MCQVTFGSLLECYKLTSSFESLRSESFMIWHINDMWAFRLVLSTFFFRFIFLRKHTELVHMLLNRQIQHPTNICVKKRLTSMDLCIRLAGRKVGEITMVGVKQNMPRPLAYTVHERNLSNWDHTKFRTWANIGNLVKLCLSQSNSKSHSDKFDTAASSLQDIKSLQWATKKL